MSEKAIKTENQEVFEYEGNFYNIPKDKYETRENYLDRVWNILNKIGDLRKMCDMNKLIKDSKIYSSKKIYECEYD